MEDLFAWLLAVTILALVAFWCACATNGTVRAALWVFPVLGALGLASAGGDWLGRQLTQTTGTLRDFVISSYHLHPYFADPLNRPTVPLFTMLLAVLLFGLFQSYRLFRTERQDSATWALRPLVPLALVALMCSVTVSAAYFASRWEPLAEVRAALVALQPGKERLQLSAADIARGAALSSHTRRWLEGSTIAVVPDQRRSSAHIADIRLPNGLACRLSFAQYLGRTFSPEPTNCRYQHP